MPNFKETKKIKASILVVTLMMIGIVLAVALTISLAAIRQRQASLGANKSTGAFQNADSGIEIAMNEITRGTSNTVGDVCNSGVLTSSAYTVKLFDATGAELKCGDLTATSKSKWSIASIKSVGANDDQEQRAIEAVVASSGPAFDSGWVAANNGSNNTITMAHNLGVYPVNCMAWFSPSNPPSGKIFPISCFNSPQEPSNNYHQPLGFSVDTTDVKLYIWSGTALFTWWNIDNWNTYNNGYIRVFLWK